MDENKREKAYYCNVAEMNSSVYDFYFVFGQKIVPSPGISDEEFRVAIHMSPQHTKALCNILTENIITYEKLYGNIKLDPLKDAVIELKAANKIQVVKSEL